MTEGKNVATEREFSVYPEHELTGAILNAAFSVHNTLGVGFLEKVYANALSVELRAANIKCEQESPLKVHYRGVAVGDYFADLIVERRVLVELKASSAFDPVHAAQLMNYLRASGIRVGLLLNFGRPKLHFKRFIC